MCGLNGSGKSTLGRALAQRLDWEFMDIEDCFFPKTDPSYLYANPRSRQEAARHFAWSAPPPRKTLCWPALKATTQGWRRCSPRRCGCGWTRPPGPGGCGSAPMRSSAADAAPAATCIQQEEAVLRLCRPAGGPRGGGLAVHPRLPRRGRWTAPCPSRRMWSGWRPILQPAENARNKPPWRLSTVAFVLQQKQGRQKSAGPVPR